MEVDLIIKRFKELKKLKSDTDLADYLGIKRPNIPQWRRRNSINLELLYSKCNKEEFIYVIYGTEKNDTNIPSITASEDPTSIVHEHLPITQQTDEQSILSILDRTIADLRSQLKVKDEQLAAKDAQLAAKDAQLAARDRMMCKLMGVEDSR